MHAGGDWQRVEGMLSKDMAATVGEYLQIWKLKLSTTKAVLVAFHLNNKKAKCELKVNHNNENLPFCSEPTILRVTFNRSFAYRRHLESLCKKLTSRVALLMRLAASGWGVGATTLRTATLVLVYSTEEYCAPVWCRSAHTGLIPLSPTTLCELLLRPIPADNLPMLAGIQPAELHRKGATPPLARHPTSVGMHGISNGDAQCACCTTTHQFIWRQWQKCGPLGGSRMEYG